MLKFFSETVHGNFEEEFKERLGEEIVDDVTEDSDIKPKIGKSEPPTPMNEDDDDEEEDEEEVGFFNRN